MAKNQKNTNTTTNNNNSSSSNSSSITVKSEEITTTKVVVKRKRKSVPRGTPPKRSSIYRGVTRHRWTGRYEAHLWDKNCWNESQNKKGRQVYLGAYDGEEAAAHAYDLAALKYWGQDTILNFPLSTYVEELKEMEGQSKEEYIGSLRRRSSGFSRGVSKYRGVARHHHNGRWEARIGRVFGNKYLYLGTYATQEEAATAYDMAAIEYRGLNAVTNFDLSRYVKWLKPDSTSQDLIPAPTPNPNQELALLTTSSSAGETETLSPVTDVNDSSTLEILLQSSEFEEMLEITSSVLNEKSPLTTPESDPPRCSFPEDIQTYFECQDSGSYVEDDDILFDFSSFSSPDFHCELDL